MKKAAILLGFLIAVGDVAHAAQADGASLAVACDLKEISQETYLSGFCRGFLDSWRQGSQIKLCGARERPPIEDIALIVRAYMRTHHAARGVVGWRAVDMAMVDAFPCSKK